MTPPVPPSPDGDAPHASPDAGGVTKRPQDRTHRRRANRIAELRGKGLSLREVASAVGVHRNTVSRALSLPEVQEAVDRYRRMFRTQALERSARMLGAAFDFAEEAVADRDAKSFDAVTRGISSLERVAASASGENKPAQVNVAVGVTTSMSAEERAELLNEFRKTLALEG